MQRLKVVHKHVNDVKTRAEGKLNSLESDEVEAIRGWAKSFQAAVSGDSARWCESLANAAAKRAEKIEHKVGTKKQGKWRELIGGGCDSGGGRRSPTALAYRWTKGLRG